LDLLRGEPGDEFKLFGEALVLGCGESVGRDEGNIDMRVFEEKREIAGAGIAEHGKDAELGAWPEEAGQVCREHGFGGGGGTGDEAKPSLRGPLWGRDARAPARQEPDQNETKR
jgi:hypothetical protein